MDIDWNTVITAITSSLLGSGFLVTILTKWIENSLKSKYEKELAEHKVKLQHEYDKNFEEFKANLQEEIVEKNRQAQEDLKKIDAKNKTDSDLFRKFMKVLPSTGSIKLLKTYNMGDPIPRKGLEQLQEFHEQWKNPELHFLDDELKKKCLQLHQATDQFVWAFAENTFPEGSQFQRISREWSDEKFTEAMNLLNSLSDKVVEIHEDFVKTAREKLNVSFFEEG